MQFREQGQKIQCIRSAYDPASKRSHQKLVAAFDKWADKIPSAESEKLTEAEQHELATWFSARQAAKADSQSKYRVSTGGSLLVGLAEAIQANSNELTEAQAAAIWQGLDKVAKALRKAGKPKAKRTST